MPVGQPITTTPKWGVRITLVDPVTGRVEGVLKTGQAIPIGVYTTTVASRWPVVGEDWMVRQENGTWILDSLWPQGSFHDVAPGDAIVNSPTGKVRVRGSVDGSTDFDLDKNSIPTHLPPSGPAGGDLAGNYPNPNVTKINGQTPGNIVTHNTSEFLTKLNNLSDLNNVVAARTNLNLGTPTRAYANTARNSVNGLVSVITMDTYPYGTPAVGAWSGGAYTPGVLGYYQVNGFMVWSASAAGQFIVPWIYNGGTQDISGSTVYGASTGWSMYASVSGIIKITNIADAIDLRYLTNLVSSITTGMGNNSLTIMRVA